MSNVIIGIIGVIVFIGLALAGASYVGTLVTDGTTQRNATQGVMTLQQTAAAAKLYNMRQRQWVPNSQTAVDTMISAGILKSRPINPLVPSNYPIIVDINGSLTGNRPAYAIMYIGQTEQARDACIEFEIQNGNLDRTAPATMETQLAFTARANTSRGGCARMPGAFGGANGGVTGDYLMWMPI